MSVPQNSSPKASSWIVAGGCILLGIGLYPRLLATFFDSQYLPKLYGVLLFLSLMVVGMGSIVLWKKQSLWQLFQENGSFNAWCFGCLLGIALCSNRLQAMDHKWLRVLIYLGLLLALLRTYYLLVVKPEAKGWKMALPTMLLPLLGLFLLSEIAFMYVAKSHGSYPLSMAQINWNRKYWGPVNSLGYRDGPHSRSQGKKQVLVLGDSFTAGAGIKQPEDRFSNLLEARYPGQAVFLNLGASGSNTSQELRRLGEADLQPDLILLGYCLNDIHDAAAAEGIELEWEALGAGLPSPLRSLCHYSHTFNYLLGAYGTSASKVDYVAWLEACFTNPAVFSRHAAELDQIHQFALRDSIPLAAVVFPLMQAPQRSARITRIVSDYFRSREVPVVDLGLRLKDYPADSLWVHPRDPHPNELVNEKAATLLADLLERHGLI